MKMKIKISIKNVCKLLHNFTWFLLNDLLTIRNHFGTSEYFIFCLCLTRDPTIWRQKPLQFQNSALNHSRDTPHRIWNCSYLSMDGAYVSCTTTVEKFVSNRLQSILCEVHSAKLIFGYRLLSFTIERILMLAPWTVNMSCIGKCPKQERATFGDISFLKRIFRINGQ